MNRKNKTSPKILYIDDERNIHAIVTKLLKQEIPNCIVFTAQSGLEGIKIAKESSPDTIILDIIMPEMDGFEVCEKLKSDEHTMHIPIMLITAIKKDPKSRIKGLEMGADTFISKPIDSGELIAQVKVLLRIKKAEDHLRKEKDILEEQVHKRTTALQESEEKFKQFFKNAPDYCYIISPNGTIIDINSSALAILRYKKEEMIGKPLITSLYAPSSRGNAKKLSNKLKKMGKLKNEELKIITKTGEERPVLLSSATVKGVDGNLLHSILIQKDITERKKVAEALETEKSYLDHLFKSAKEAIVMGDKNHKVLRVNDEFIRLFGYTNKEIQGQIADDLIVPKEQIDEAISITKRVGNRKEIYCEAVRKRKDGTLINVSIIASPIIVQNKQIGVYAIYRDITARKNAEKELLKSLKKLQDSLESTVNALASTLEKRDPYTAGHQQRVAKLACAIAKKMNLSEKRTEGLRIASLLHDIGKVSIPAEILNKPSHLTETEFNLIKTHPQIAYDVLKNIDFPWPVAQIVLQHHEKIDGSGYPFRLSGEEILLEARILTVSDIMEALSSHRPYRPAFNIKIALNEIVKGSGIQYDKNVVDACIEVFKNRKFLRKW